MHFGENELSPSSIGFSPLNLPHLPTFQRRWVRASTVSYHSFTLDRLRSPGFASTPSDYVALFRLGFPSAPLYLTSPLNVTRRIILQKARHHPCGLWPLVSTQFQVLFHSLPGFFSPFPHGTIRYRLVRVFSLTRYGPRRFTQNSSCSMLLGREHTHYAVYLYRIITFYDLAFQLIPVQRIIMLNILQFFNCSSHNPT